MIARALVYSVIVTGLACSSAPAQPLAPQMPPPGTAETAIGAQPPDPVPLVPQQPTPPPPAQIVPQVSGPFATETDAALPEVDEDVQSEMARALPDAITAPGDDTEAAEPAQAAAEPETEAEPELPFDVNPFLGAMVELRGAAQTCEPFVGDDPVGRTNTIPQFFAMLEQELPELTNETTQASLRQFIGSQAASLCVNMLNGAFFRYAEAATDYQARKPDEWPPAPPVQPGMWCAQPYCLDR
jgi:hypothetical protein